MGPFPGQGGSAGLYGLGNGSGFSVGDLTLGVGPPGQAGDFVHGGGIAGALAAAAWNCSASIASPFGIKSRRRARTISGKAPPQPKMALATI